MVGLPKLIRDELTYPDRSSILKPYRETSKNATTTEYEVRKKVSQKTSPQAMFFVSGWFSSVLGGERPGYIFWIRTANGGISR
jgi:hypothetical protein